jgi:hypothetical protein
VDRQKRYCKWEVCKKQQLTDQEGLGLSLKPLGQPCHSMHSHSIRHQKNQGETMLMTENVKALLCGLAHLASFFAFAFSAAFSF